MYHGYRIACEQHATLVPNSFKRGSSTDSCTRRAICRQMLPYHNICACHFSEFRLASANGGQHPMLPTGCLAAQCAIIS